MDQRYCLRLKHPGEHDKLRVLEEDIWSRPRTVDILEHLLSTIQGHLRQLDYSTVFRLPDASRATNGGSCLPGQSITLSIWSSFGLTTTFQCLFSYFFWTLVNLFFLIFPFSFFFSFGMEGYGSFCFTLSSREMKEGKFVHGKRVSETAKLTIRLARCEGL